uniref:Glucose-methanol-choline oxidoreductase N-terminal domain-containing protein n=1 Tax=Homalodisca liturata TaxID=320908 RepID=A0A1B6JVY6_9HEMI
MPTLAGFASWTTHAALAIAFIFCDLIKKSESAGTKCYSGSSAMDNEVCDLPMTWYSDGNTCSWVHYLCTVNSSDFAEQTINALNYDLQLAEIDLANPKHYPTQYNPTNGEIFDFIVVGAGSAGTVLANRLTEVSGWKVLLLEAGGNPTKATEVPLYVNSLQTPELDWMYKTYPSPYNCLGMVNKSCKWARGKVLGGSSTINYMMYVRGNHRDYDNWAENGNDGWSYQDILPYFKKSEDMRSVEILTTEDAGVYHGTGGYLKVESWNTPEVDILMETFGKGMEEVGYSFNTDYNGQHQTGYTKTQGTLLDGRRCNTAKAFLSPIKDRPNLKVSKYSLATKILIDKNLSQAYGVHFINHKGESIEVYAKKEVILSAGAINSPKLLMLSGIGPAQHLVELGIPIIKNLSVGENLQDHVFMTGIPMTVDYDLPSFSPVKSMYDFLMKRTSRLSSLSTFAYVTFFNTLTGVDPPDFQLINLGFGKNNSIDLQEFLALFNHQDYIVNEFIKIIEHSFTFVLLPTLITPQSRGRILLQSSDPEVDPVIIPGYFSDKSDIEAFLRVYDFLSLFTQTDAMKNINATLHEIRISACEIHTFTSTEYRECALRHLTASAYHYAGTCKMGPSSDYTAVVNPDLKVHGIQGLRVIDASIMPTVVRGNTNAACVMIAEKASDLVKNTWLT